MPVLLRDATVPHLSYYNSSLLLILDLVFPGIKNLRSELPQLGQNSAVLYCMLTSYACMRKRLKGIQELLSLSVRLRPGMHLGRPLLEGF
jgi:hypothetical protein